MWPRSHRDNCERSVRKIPVLNGLQTHSWHNLAEIRGAVAEVSAQQLWIVSTAKAQFCFCTHLHWQDELWTKQGAWEERKSAQWARTAQIFFFPLVIYLNNSNYKMRLLMLRQPDDCHRGQGSTVLLSAKSLMLWAALSAVSPFLWQSFLLYKKREKKRRKGKNLLENLGDCTRARALLEHISNLNVCGHIVKEMFLNNSSVAVCLWRKLI